MKFGDTLYQRSVPQWATYNVDYNEIKQLIKTRTSSTFTEPVAIPGQGEGDERWQTLENELFAILYAQHERVSLFIRSKYGEIGRKITHLERQTRAVQRSVGDTQGGRPIQQTRKYQKLVEVVDNIGDDIQNVSQFASAQRLAFKKILKKYQKWTGSFGLGFRVSNEVLNQPIDPLRPDLGPYLERLSDVSSTIRNMGEIPRPNRSISSQARLSTAQKSSASRLHAAARVNMILEIDAAFASVPLGKAAGRAIYWIHPDNLDEARVLLLRHMRDLQAKASAISRGGSTISVASQTQSASSNEAISQKDRAHVVLFDNLQRFVQEQGGVTVSQSEDTEGSVPSKVALSGRWNDEPEAVVIMSDLAPSVVPGSRSHCVNIRRKDLANVLSRDRKTSSKGKSSSDEENVRTIREFLVQHRDVKPLAEAHSTKSRFAGINNSAEVGTWAMLDTDITMSSVSMSTLGIRSDKQHIIETDDGIAFPHGVLEIRWEFAPTPEVVRAFDNTHLAERVRGFSLEAHTIHTICKSDTPHPLWQSLLERDIRKVPLAPSRQARRKAANEQERIATSTITSSGPSSTEGISDSVFSKTHKHSSATSAYTPHTSSPELTSPVESKAPVQDLPQKKKKKSRKNSIQPVQRYWNEFDDGSEIAEEDAYAIYVTPDDPITLPGAETVSKAFSAMYQGIAEGKKRVVSWLPLQPNKHQDPERRPLLQKQPSSDPDLEDSSSSEAEAEARTAPAWAVRKSKISRSLSRSSTPMSRTMSMAGGQGRPMSVRRQARERILLRTYAGLLVLSSVLLAMSTIMKTTGRKKAVLEVDVGVISGVVVAAACAMIAVGLMCMRKKGMVSVPHQLTIWLAFAIVMIWGAGLLVLVALGKVA